MCLDHSEVRGACGLFMPSGIAFQDLVREVFELNESGML